MWCIVLERNKQNCRNGAYSQVFRLGQPQRAYDVISPSFAYENRGGHMTSYHMPVNTWREQRCRFPTMTHERVAFGCTIRYNYHVKGTPYSFKLFRKDEERKNKEWIFRLSHIDSAPKTFSCAFGYRLCSKLFTSDCFEEKREENRSTMSSSGYHAGDK